MSPSAAREGLDWLLAQNPELDVARIEGQVAKPDREQQDEGGMVWVELGRTAGPWVEVDFENGDRYAIWKWTGAVYRVGKGGAVEEDAILEGT